jgi:hypothetical protein
MIRNLRRRRRRTRAALPTLVAIAVSAAPATGAADGSGFSFSGGIDYTTGAYGSTTDTEILSVPFSMKYETERWTFAVTAPYISINGPGDVVGGTDSPIVTKKGKSKGVTTQTEESGLGDIVGAVSYSVVVPNDTLPGVDLTGKIKFPTADESKNLGTGEFDYTLLVDVYQRFGRLTPYAGVGYRVLGEPDGVELNNQFLLGVGASYDLSESLVGGLALDDRTSSSDQSDDPLELTPYLTWKATRSLKFNVYGVLGLSDGSPDYGGGVRLVAAP